jgi:hypothetical protein
MVSSARFRKHKCFIIRLPDEVLVEEIMLELAIEDVMALRRVCVEFYLFLVLQRLTVCLIVRSASYSTSLPISQSFGRPFYAP